ALRAMRIPVSRFSERAAGWGSPRLGSREPGLADSVCVNDNENRYASQQRPLENSVSAALSTAFLQRSSSAPCDSAPCDEERLEHGRARLGLHAGFTFQAMIQRCMLGDVEDRAGSAGPGIGRAEHQALDAGM